MYLRERGKQENREKPKEKLEEKTGTKTIIVWERFSFHRQS